MLWRRRRRAWRTLRQPCRRCACARGRTRSRRWSVWRRLRRGGWCRHGQAHGEVWSQRSITRSAGLVQRNLPSSGSRTRLRCHRSSRLCVAHGSFRVCHGFHRARSKSKREGTICSLLCLRSKSEQKENAKRAPSRILELYTPPGFMFTHELKHEKRHYSHSRESDNCQHNACRVLSCVPSVPSHVRIRGCVSGRISMRISVVCGMGRR